MPPHQRRWRHFCLFTQHSTLNTQHCAERFVLTAVLAIAGLAGAFGLLLGYASVRFKVEGDPVVDQVDALLPQSQCGQCGYPGCRPYAEAVAAGEVEVNLCTPGGEAVMVALADLLGREPKPLEETEASGPLVARIDERTCIGCTLCIQACPVDAIVGSAKQLHTVIESECTGCKLCLPPCPVECITMQPVPASPRTWKWPYPGREAA
jgi:electron transport complex protein RnfB